MNAADGSKLKKTVTDGSTNKTVDYLDGFQYEDEILSFFPHAEGYIKVVTGNISGYSYHYVYNYTDHLGNIRLRYTKHPLTGEIEPLEENHYYPFACPVRSFRGLKHQGYNPNHQVFEFDPIEGNVALITIPQNATDGYHYKYNGKEHQDELGLDWYDYGARNYQADLGRWMNVDPLAEKYPGWSPYVYVHNNPLRYTDPTGMSADDIIYLDENNNEIGRIEQEGAHEYYRINGTLPAVDGSLEGSGAPTFERVESPVEISYRAGVNQGVVSVKSENTLQDIGLESRVFEIDVTSTARDAQGQATAMYSNLERDYDEQRGLYRGPGQRVIDAYDTAVGEGLDRNGVIEAMTNRIIEIGPGNVSRHAANPSEINVLDISQRNIPANSRTKFQNAANRREGVRMLNENRVFHIEINQ